MKITCSTSADTSVPAQQYFDTDGEHKFKPYDSLLQSPTLSSSTPTTVSKYYCICAV